jgi:hypothetical protein
VQIFLSVNVRRKRFVHPPNDDNTAQEHSGQRDKKNMSPFAKVPFNLPAGLEDARFGRRLKHLEVDAGYFMIQGFEKATKSVRLT